MTDPISPFVNGTLPPDADPAEVVAYIVAVPQWAFTANPVKAISTASVRAAEAFKRGDWQRTRLWTRIGLGLCEASGRAPGASLSQLALRFA